jgi:GT2 family glycosyltransferase
MKRIAILLTVFNRREKTLACLANLYHQVGVNVDYLLDVFLVDDGCTDGTSGAIKEEFPFVHVIAGSGDLYWNRGMHLAWKTAYEQYDYDYYLWLNDDTNLSDSALSIMLALSEEKSNEAIIVGSTSAQTSDKLTYGGRARNGSLIKPKDTFQECISFNGNVVLFPRYVFKKVGMNDPLFTHALGDFDYGLRARRLGVKSFITAGYVGKCDAHDSLPTWCNPNKSFSIRWKAFRTPLGQNPEQFFIFERRHHGLLAALFHYFTNHLRVCVPQLWQLKNT